MLPKFRSFLPLLIAMWLIAGAYMTVSPPNAAAVSTLEAKAFSRPSNAEKTPSLPIPGAVIDSTKAPVPLLVAKHESYFVDQPANSEAQQPAAIKTDVPTNQSSENPSTSDTTAKTMIEGDGYTNVKGLSKGSDGNWHGRAMRGSSEIAVTVGVTGNVSAE